MILLREYSKEERIDRIWYDSSMIVYSECYDDVNSRTKDLKVVFKNGGTYLYRGVDVDDYVMFVHGGLDGSNGKALNKFIKGKCEYVKEKDTDVSLLTEELNRRLATIKEENEKKEKDKIVAEATDAEESNEIPSFKEGEIATYRGYVINGTGYTCYDVMVLEDLGNARYLVRDIYHGNSFECPVYEKVLWAEDKENPSKSVYNVTELVKKEPQ